MIIKCGVKAKELVSGLNERKFIIAFAYIIENIVAYIQGDST